MTVRELIEQLSRVENQQAEVMARHSWLPGPKHYTMGLESFGMTEPVLVMTWRTNQPEDDVETARPSDLFDQSQLD